MPRLLVLLALGLSVGAFFAPLDDFFVNLDDLGEHRLAPSLLAIRLERGRPS